MPTSRLFNSELSAYWFWLRQLLTCEFILQELPGHKHGPENSATEIGLFQIGQLMAAMIHRVFAYDKISRKGLAKARRTISCPVLQGEAGRWSLAAADFNRPAGQVVLLLGLNCVPASGTLLLVKSKTEATRVLFFHTGEFRLLKHNRKVQNRFVCRLG